MENVSEIVNTSSAAVPELDGVGVGLEIALGILALFILFIACAACASCEGGAIYDDVRMPGPPESNIRRSPTPYPQSVPL